MRIRHLTLELVSLGALILLCTVWWSEGVEIWVLTTK